MTPAQLIPIVVSAARLAAPLGLLPPTLARLLPGAAEMIHDCSVLEAQVRTLLDEASSARLDAELRGLRAHIQAAAADLATALQEA